MKRPMHCLGVGTTAQKGGVILILTLFSIRISMLVRSGTSCDHRCCSRAKGFRLHYAFRTALLKAADQDQSYLNMFKSVLKGEKNVHTSLSIIKDLLCYKNRWYIPKDKALKRIIMEAKHDSRMAGQIGTYKTIGRVRANFYWPKMHQQKWILRLIRRRCVLTQATYFLRPLRPVCPDLRSNLPCVLTQGHILPKSRQPQTLDLVLLASSPRPDVSRPSSPLSQLQLIRCFLRHRPASGAAAPFFFHIIPFTSPISRLIGLVN